MMKPIELWTFPLQPSVPLLFTTVGFHTIEARGKGLHLPLRYNGLRI